MWARLKASAGHIWPSGRMLCMPALTETMHCENFEKKNQNFFPYRMWRRMPLVHSPLGQN